MAKYPYEPLRSSPNDHPEIELPLKPGDYYLVYGDMDEVRVLVEATMPTAVLVA